MHIEKTVCDALSSYPQIQLLSVVVDEGDPQCCVTIDLCIRGIRGSFTTIIRRDWKLVSTSYGGNLASSRAEGISIADILTDIFVDITSHSGKQSS